MQELIGTRHGDFHLGLDQASVPRGSARSTGAQPDSLWYMFDCDPPKLTDDERKKRDKQLEAIASKMAWEDQPTDPSSDSQIPAGYTIFGQFITHDLTFNTRPLDGRNVDPVKGDGRRTPQLDLDSIYERSPRLAYDPPREDERPERMRYGRKPGLPDDLPRYDDVKRDNDLVVYPVDRAIIGDVRNDDNVLISQLHLAFLKLHNQFVGYVLRNKSDFPNEAVFDAARRLCTWHYQWVVAFDYLPRIVGWETVKRVLDQPDERDPSLGFRLYAPPDGVPRIPVEFSAAALRFGHSMIRSHYRVNKAGIEYPLFGSSADDRRHLGGQRRLPAMLEVDWTRFFFESSPRTETTDEDAGEPAALPSASLSAEASEARERAEARLRRLRAKAVDAREKANEARGAAEKAKARADAADTKAAQDEAKEARIQAHEAERQAEAAEARATAEEAKLLADDAEALADAVDVAVGAEAAGTTVGSEAANPREVARAARRRAVEAAEAQAVAELEVFSKFPGIFARKLDSHLTQILANVPKDILPPDDRFSTKSLALRDLERGDRLGLASGQSVAGDVRDRLGLDFHIFSNAELGLAEIGLHEGEAPLWFYLLKEAEILGSGEHLGPVGGRIVAEVILGVLACDPESFIHTDFRPVVRSESKERGLTMADLLRYAGELDADDED